MNFSRASTTSSLDAHTIEEEGTNELAIDEQMASENIDKRETLKTRAVLVPSGSTGGFFHTFLLVAAIILIISSIVLIILGAVDSRSTIFIQSITVFRTGIGAVSTNVDSFPAPVVSALNDINITLVYGVAQIAAGIGLMLMYFLFDSMLSEVTYGSNGYLWAGIIIATILYDVIIALRCGLQDLTVLIFDGMLHFSILAIFWLGDLLNQRFYRATMRELGLGRFSYAFLVLAVIVFIPLWGMQFVALGFAETGTAGAPTVDIVVPILAAILYVLMFVLVGLHYGGVSYLAETYSRDVGIVILVALTVLIVPWIDVILFFTTTFVTTCPAAGAQTCKF